MLDPLPLCTEVRIPVEDGFQIYSKSLGAGEAPPLLLLHGGPGAPHDYLENLQELAGPQQRVIFFDQLGCGRSDQPDEPSRWRFPRFLREIDAVRAALGLDELILLGQSWGGMLALEYALEQPRGLKGLILASATPSTRLWTEEAQGLRKGLPQDIQDILDRCEAEGWTDTPEYQAAMEIFYQRHVIRIPMPDFVLRSFSRIGQPYSIMWGPSEFHPTGNLLDWDVTPRLGEISVPTLLISGEFDESTPRINRILQQGIRGARWELIPGCSHLSHVEAPEAFLKAVRNFLGQLSNHKDPMTSHEKANGTSRLHQ